MKLSPCHKLLKICTSQVLLQCGFQKASPQSLIALTNVLEHLIHALCIRISQLPQNIAINELIRDEDGLMGVLNLCRGSGESILHVMNILPRDCNFARRGGGVKVMQAGDESVASMYDAGVYAFVNGGFGSENNILDISNKDMKEISSKKFLGDNNCDNFVNERNINDNNKVRDNENSVKEKDSYDNNYFNNDNNKVTDNKNSTKEKDLCDYQINNTNTNKNSTETEFTEITHKNVDNNNQNRIEIELTNSKCSNKETSYNINEIENKKFVPQNKFIDKNHKTKKEDTKFLSQLENKNFFDENEFLKLQEGGWDESFEVNIYDEIISEITHKEGWMNIKDYKTLLENRSKENNKFNCYENKTNINFIDELKFYNKKEVDKGKKR
ncbi:hypothetical protein COBT_000056 [Conglomerata obtusa]